MLILIFVSDISINSLIWTCSCIFLCCYFLVRSCSICRFQLWKHLKITMERVFHVVFNVWQSVLYMNGLQSYFHFCQHFSSFACMTFRPFWGLTHSGWHFFKNLFSVCNLHDGRVTCVLWCWPQSATLILWFLKSHPQISIRDLVLLCHLNVQVMLFRFYGCLKWQFFCC